MTFIEKIINLIDYYHQKKIVKYFYDKRITTIIDVGAHKGEYINYILELKPRKIIAFEPQKKIYKELLNRYKNLSNITFFNICLSEKKQNKIFYINELSSTSSLIQTNNNSLWVKLKKLILNKKDLVKEKIDIKTETLDNLLLRKINKNDITLLKIDVEGAEYQVLKGGYNLIKNKNIKYIQVEQAKSNIYKINAKKHVHNFLINNGYILDKSILFPTLHFSDNIYMKIK